MIEKGKYGCKLGANCSKRPYNDKYIQEYYDMNKLLKKFDLHSLMKWASSKNIYKTFLLEHSTYCRCNDYNKLPIDVKAHLKDYIINRLSTSNPNELLYKSAFDFFSKLDEINKNQKVSVMAKANINDYGNSSVDLRYHTTGKKGEECQRLANNGFRGLCTHLQARYNTNANGVQSDNPNAPWLQAVQYCDTCRDYYCLSGSSLKAVYNYCRNFNYTWRGEPYVGKSKDGAKSDYDFNQWSKFINSKDYQDGKKTTPELENENPANDGVLDEVADSNTGGTGSTDTSSPTGQPLLDRGFYGQSEYDEYGKNKDKELIIHFDSWDAEGALEWLKEKIIDPTAEKFRDAYGNIMNWVKSNTIPGYNAKGHIMGLPMFYNALCDPDSRVFSENTLSDLPLVYLMPGKGIVNPANKEELQDELKNYFNNYEDDLTEGVVRNLKGIRDARALAFEPCFEEYLDYLNNLASTVWGLLGLGGCFEWDEQLGMATWDLDPKQRSLVYFAHSSTTASDQFANSYDESRLKQTVNGASLLAREYRQLAGKDMTDSVFELFGVSAGNTSNSANEDGEQGDPNMLGNVNTGGGTLTSLIQSLQTGLVRVLNGTNLMFPQIWSDSTFEKSYNITFRFYSAYGDKEALFNNVYFPLITLLCLTLPRMDNISGYAQPFYVRMNVPGYMQIDMGVVTSMTVERGGDDKLWTIDGLPNEIEVTLTIGDMYANMAQTKNSTLMSFNAGLTAYLDCMAGIRTDDLININKFGGVLKNRMSKAYKMIGTGPGLWINESYQSFINNILT